MSERTDYTDPSTIDVDEVMANIDQAFRARGRWWTDKLDWPNVTVKALADEIERLRAEVVPEGRCFEQSAGEHHVATVTLSRWYEQGHSITVECVCGTVVTTSGEEILAERHNERLAARLLADAVEVWITSPAGAPKMNAYTELLCALERLRAVTSG